MKLNDKINAAKFCIDNNLLAIVKYSHEAGLGIFQGMGKEDRVDEVVAKIKAVYTPAPPTEEDIRELKEIDPDFEIPEIDKDEYFLEFIYIPNPLKNTHRKGTMPLKYLDIAPMWVSADDSL